MTNAQMTPINPERNPIVFTKDGEVFAGSRDVAAFFDKRHHHVLDTILCGVKSPNSTALVASSATPVTGKP